MCLIILAGGGNIFIMFRKVFVKQNATFIITGASGFIGGHLINELLRRGLRVVALDCSPPRKKIDGVEYHIVDITNRDKFKKTFSKIAAFADDLYVFHLAGQVDIPESIKLPEYSYYTNIIGSLNIFESCRKTKNLRKLVFLSTQSVNANYSPYATGKMCVELMAKSYFETYNMPVVVARLANVYGPGQQIKAVIPNILSQMICEKVIKIGNLKARKDFIFVEDAASALVEVALDEKISEEQVVIGTGKATLVSDIIKLARQITKFDGKIVIDKKRLRKESHVQCPPLKNKKLVKINYTLRQGLTKTYEFIKDSQNEKR